MTHEATRVPRRGPRGRTTALLTAALVLAAGCRSAPEPRGGGAAKAPGSYRVLGKTYTPLRSADGFSEVGYASWYGPGFHGRKTANGETYDMYARTAAHKLLPLGTVVRVTNLENGRTAEARINDRGPFVAGRVIDLSYALARDLDVVDRGTARVRVEALRGPGGRAPPPQDLTGPFAWQVGAFTVTENARRLARDLGPVFGEITVEPYDRAGTRFHRVRVGRYRTQAEARAALPRLHARGFTPFLVRRD